MVNDLFLQDRARAREEGQDRRSHDVVSPSYDPAVSKSGHFGRFHPDAAASDAIPRLAPGVGLIVVLLLSFGLWGAVWLVAFALIAAGPW
jgi:hypothetical protein